METVAMINKDSYVTANFIDAERKTLEVLLKHPTNEKELTPYIIEASEEQADYKDLMKLVTEDQLHEQTWETKKRESDAFLAMARQIAKDAFEEEEGFAIANINASEKDSIARLNANEIDSIARVNEASAANAAVDQNTLISKTRIYPTIVDTIFTNMENEDHLFALKLALFEIQEIRESTDTKTKTALRKGKNKIEVLQHAFNLTGVRQTQHDDKSISTPEDNDAAIKEVEAKPVVEGNMTAAVKVDVAPTKGAAKKVAAKKTTAKKKA